jgi:hypothetical protein
VNPRPSNEVNVFEEDGRILADEQQVAFDQSAVGEPEIEPDESSEQESEKEPDESTEWEGE